MYATLSFPLAAKTINNFSPRNPVVCIRNSMHSAMATATANDRKKAALALAVAGSLYEILRVERTASFNEIKTAYRSLAKMYHPDTTGSSSDGHDFIVIQNAYATLSDPMARATYDLSLGTRARRLRTRVYPTRRWETDQCW